MLVFGFLTIFVVATSGATSINCNDGGFYIRADPKSQNNFYKCDNGKAVRFTCPSGLMYNPKIHVCDWPRNVESPGKNSQSNQQSGKPANNAGQQYNSGSAKPINNGGQQYNSGSTKPINNGDQQYNSGSAKPINNGGQQYNSGNTKPINNAGQQYSNNNKNPAYNVDDSQGNNGGNTPWHLESYDIGYDQDFPAVQVIDNSLKPKKNGRKN